MRNFSSRSKRIWSFIGVILLVALVVTLVISLIPKKTDDGYKEVKTDWAIGSMASGKYVDDNSVNLVSDYIEINEGFRIVIDFDKECEFAYYLYDKDKNVIGEVYGPFDNSKTVNDFNGEAKYVRFILSNFDDADDHINTFEKWEYSNYITIYTLEETKEE